MNVVLNTEEAHVVLALVTSSVLDHVEISEEAKDRVRELRRDHGPGTPGLDGFTERLNEAIGNYIDERTRRMMRQRGKLKVQG
ncbi:MAG: hypothetical protein WD058_04390 [Dehalococcoidia bacterium]